MKGGWKLVVQSVIRRLGYQLRRLDPETSLVDPYREQQRLAASASMIFEVGAADGRDCERYRGLFPGSTIHAFEPLPENFVKLSDRVAADPLTEAHEMALCDFEGKAQFHVGAWADASSLLLAKKTGSTFDSYQASTGTVEVQTSTLDVFAASRGICTIDILKMDAQGAELAILQGAKGLLSAGAIRIIYTEAQFRPLYEGAGTFAEISTYLEQFGFVLHNLFNLHHNQRGEICWCDALFVSEGAAG